ncbi:MAG: CDP-alcohol phosphatidyltransferase family protein [Desulfobulbus sp.]|nr:MAG: CDP-alcohol phosphatidyltransferase family protein [Desulfobulbus sp.]
MTLLRMIPNLLSTFRLLLALVFPFCPQSEWIWLVLAGGASDVLDGWIARRWHLESWQGSLLDAVADKLFVLSVLVTFVLSGRFSPWWVPGLIVRDLTVALIALYAFCRREWESFRQMKASISGKLATAGQFLFFATVVLAPAFIDTIFAVAVLFSILAALDYGRRFILALRQRAVEKSI